MPAYPIVRFVNSIAVAPTIDLDLNNELPFTVHADDFSLGSPTYAGDPLSVGGKWGYQTLQLAVQVKGGGTAAALAAFSALARQVTVDNLLMVQWDGAQPPVFFKTYKTQQSEIDMTNMFVQAGVSYYKLMVSLTADGAWGLPVTVTPTIANDPVAGTNPCFYRFGTVLGDLETPLYAEAPASDVRGQTRMLSSSALISPATQTGPVFVQNTALTHAGAVGGGVAPVGTLVDNTGDAAMAGGNYTRYTGNVADDGTVAPVALLYGLSLSAAARVGDYRVFMRVRCGTAVDLWSFSLAQISGTSPNYATYTGPVTPYIRDTTGPHWLDMGVFRFPFGAPPVDVFFDTAYTSPGLSFAVLMHTDAVAAKTVDFDGLLFVPTGLDQAISSKYGETGYDKSLPGTTYKAVWNGLIDTRYLLDGSNNYSPGIAPMTPGDLPTVTPGADNSIHYLQHIGTGVNDPRTTGTTGTNDVLTATTVLTLKYFPRYMWLRPAGG